MSRPWICDVCGGEVPESEQWRLRRTYVFELFMGGWWTSKDICGSCIKAIGAAVRKAKEARA